MSSLRKTVLQKSLRKSVIARDKINRSGIEKIIEVVPIDRNGEKVKIIEIVPTDKKDGKVTENKKQEDKEMKGKENKVIESRKSELSKFSHQSLVDIAFECEIKYKRLQASVEQMKSLANEITKDHVNEKAGLVETKKKLLENIFKVEQEKFALQDKNKELSDRVDQLENQVDTLKKQLDEYHLKENMTIREKSFCSKAATPSCLSRANRRKMNYEKLFVAPVKTSKELIYENALLDLQEILDFYSLLTGISVWIDSNLNEEIGDEDVPPKCFFNCSVQSINSSINGHEFGMVINYFDNSFIFKPKTFESKFRDILPQAFSSELKYNIDDGYLFLKWYFTQLYDIK